MSSFSTAKNNENDLINKENMSLVKLLTLIKNSACNGHTQFLFDRKFWGFFLLLCTRDKRIILVDHSKKILNL